MHRGARGLYDQTPGETPARSPVHGHWAFWRRRGTQRVLLLGSPRRHPALPWEACDHHVLATRGWAAPPALALCSVSIPLPSFLTGRCPFMSKMLGLYRILLSAVLQFVQQRRPAWGHREVLRAGQSGRAPGGPSSGQAAPPLPQKAPL